MQNRLSNLIERARNLVELDSIIEFNISLDDISDIVKKLNVLLPKDFVSISSKISADSFATMQFFHTLVGSNEIVDNNLDLRKEYAEQSDNKADMSRILALSDDDGGSVFMITQDSPEKPTPVIWCDAGDMFHYSINGTFPHPHDEWPSFTDFFEYLVEKEEEKLREDGKTSISHC